MAVTKIWAIKDSLQRVLDYAANPNKTEYDALAQTLHYAENDTKTKLNESAQLVTGIHCRADHVWEDMRAVQERFGKTDGVVALHAYQSFREGEVTPEQCHEIGVALARKVWGKRFQVLVATHMNTNNLHNHFVINSVSYVDGKKYEQRRSQYAEFRAASDKLCREYGLSVVEQPKAKEPARYARMREAIDQACEDASTAEDFHRALYRQGYIFGSDPNRRYATIRARDGGRAVRLYRLGEEYDLAAIDDRLRENYLLYGAGLYERKHPPRQYTPKRYRPKDTYAGKGILQIFLEVLLLLSAGYPAQETATAYQPPGTGAHLERYRENSCRTRFCSRPQVPVFTGNRGLPQGFVPADRNLCRTAGGNRQADAPKGCSAGVG